MQRVRDAMRCLQLHVTLLKVVNSNCQRAAQRHSAAGRLERRSPARPHAPGPASASGQSSATRTARIALPLCAPKVLVVELRAGDAHRHARLAVPQAAIHGALCGTRRRVSCASCTTHSSATHTRLPVGRVRVAHVRLQRGLRGRSAKRAGCERQRKAPAASCRSRVARLKLSTSAGASSCASAGRAEVHAWRTWSKETTVALRGSKYALPSASAASAVTRTCGRARVQQQATRGVECGAGRVSLQGVGTSNRAVASHRRQGARAACRGPCPRRQASRQPPYGPRCAGAQPQARRHPPAPRPPAGSSGLQRVRMSCAPKRAVADAHALCAMWPNSPGGAWRSRLATCSSAMLRERQRAVQQ